jgi:hypothetical protein
MLIVPTQQTMRKAMVPEYIPRPGVERKVAILGTASTVYYTPWFDPSWEIWGHASGKDLYGRYDVLFDMHPPTEFTKVKPWDPNYYKFLKGCTKPVIMQQHYREIPASVRYPKEQVFSQHRVHFGNQTDLMIALLLSQGVTHIGLFGVHYQFDNVERRIQFTTLKYWMGYLEGRGVRLVLPPGSPLFDEPKWIYGYSSHDPEYRSQWEEANKLPPQSKGIRVVTPQEAKAQARTDIGMAPAWDRFARMVAGKPPIRKPLDPSEYPIGAKPIRFVPPEDAHSAEAEAALTVNKTTKPKEKAHVATEEGKIAGGSRDGVRVGSVGNADVDPARKRRSGTRRSKVGRTDNDGNGRRRAGANGGSGIKSAGRPNPAGNTRKHHGDAGGRAEGGSVRAGKQPAGRRSRS